MCLDLMSESMHCVPERDDDIMGGERKAAQIIRLSGTLETRALCPTKSSPPSRAGTDTTRLVLSGAAHAFDISCGHTAAA